MGPNAQALLNVTGKFKNSYLLQEQENKKLQQDSGEVKKKRKGKRETFNHLLVGRVKDTHIHFSFIIQASIVNAEDGPSEWTTCVIDQ